MPKDSMPENTSTRYPIDGPKPGPIRVDISWSAQFRLERLASYYDLSHNQMLSQLISQAHQNILNTLSDSQAQDYLYKRLDKI